jgi:SpoVK/Ycf46/Vps4 family AAA+-type ATPase
MAFRCAKLPDVTRIVVTGTVMFHVNAVFALARLLQPMLIIFEDVDLIFSARQTNLYGSVLGDLLDQMDGLRPYEDMDRLVAESDGATQAFLKEWVHRAVQIALERVGNPSDGPSVSNEDFRHALSEMRKFSEGSTGRIIGFHVG